MKAGQPELCYRRAAVQESTSAGLVVILYDMLASDLRQAIAAMRKGSIQDRSDRLKHAFAILELLEGSLDIENGGTCAQSLAQFYSHIRSQMLAAQFNSDEQLLEKQIALVLDVQQAWRQADSEVVSGEMSRRAAASDFDGPELTPLQAVGRSQWSA